MLAVRQLVHGGDFAVADVRCSHRGGHRSAPEAIGADKLIIPRRGTFCRRVDGRWDVLEPNVAYFQRAGDEQQIAHPLDGGDRCIAISFGRRLVDGELPVRPFATAPAADLGARRVCARALAGACADDLEEAVVAVVAGALRAARGEARGQASPARRRLGMQAREALAADPGLRLAALAGRLGCSSEHLGRAFREATGASFTVYRRRLRVRRALERIGEGEVNLARVAADAGFADHAHMTRSIRAELGAPPVRLRELLAS